MKRSLQLFATILASVASVSSYAQTAITLDHSNITGLVKGTVHTHTASVTGVTVPKTGANQVWDYSGLSGGADVSTNLLSDTLLHTKMWFRLHLSNQISFTTLITKVISSLEEQFHIRIIATQLLLVIRKTVPFGTCKPIKVARISLHFLPQWEVHGHLKQYILWYRK